MSLSKEEKKELHQIGEHFRKIEKLAVENNIDLDVFMSEYKDGGYSVYATEKVSLTTNAEDRKSIFQKAQKAKSTKSTAKSQL